MSYDVDALVQEWDLEEPKYQRLGKCVEKYLREHIYELEILPEISTRVKDLLSIIRKIKKKKRENPSYDFQDLRDKLGVRIICNFSQDMDKVDAFLQKHFDVKKVEYKKDTLDHNRLDYISNHYDVSIKPTIGFFKRHKDLGTLIFEIQVRTLNQHAWSNTSHAISYKQEAEISPLLKRRVYRLLSLYEIADDEFASVNTALLADPDNYVYALLRKTEGKIYRFAKADFDRDTSLFTLNILKSYFKDEQLQTILKGLDGFITRHEEKIRRIFRDNRKRFVKYPYLTQPEIFVIWFALEEFPFSITDNWENDFDLQELEQIKTFWGRLID